MGPFVGDEVGLPTKSFPTLGTFIRLLPQVGALKAYELANFPSLGWRVPVVLSWGVSLGSPRATVSLEVTLPIGLPTTCSSRHLP